MPWQRRSGDKVRTGLIAPSAGPANWPFRSQRSELGERDALVLQLYFVEELNLDEIGQILNVGAARVCQIKKAALEKVRGKLEEWI